MFIISIITTIQPAKTEAPTREASKGVGPEDGGRTGAG